MTILLEVQVCEVFSEDNIIIAKVSNKKDKPYVEQYQDANFGHHRL